MYLDWLKGKTIESAEAGSEEDYILFRFTNGSRLLLTAERWNCSGARMRDFASFAHREEKPKEDASHGPR